jgi:hypothetical protein
VNKSIFNSIFSPESLEKYAKKKGINNLIVRRRSDGFYLYLDGEYAFSSPKYEDCAVHIDILSLHQNF